MKVPYNYLQYEFSNPTNIIRDWKRLIKSTDFTLGKYMYDFENMFKKYINSKYCIATNNGTDALILCLKALGVSKGDEVITVGNTFYATVGAIVAVGATPVLSDCDDRYQIDIEDVEKKITKKTRVILPVHWAGASPEMGKILKIANKYNLKIIEDACMGIGAKINKRSPGTFGTVSAFSMHPLKSLNVMGDGGAIVTNDKKIYHWMLKYRNHGMVDRDHIDIWGVNYRMQPLQSIVAMHGLRKIDKVIEKRKKNAELYDKNLSKLKPNVKLPVRLDGYSETYALYMILCKKRNELNKFLNENGVEAKIHYPIPLNKQLAYKRSYRKVTLKNCENQAEHLLTLPVHQYLNNKQINYTINLIKKFYS
jgi:aminotransferase EvaB